MPSIYRIKATFYSIDFNNVTLWGDEKSITAFESLLNNYVKAEIKRMTPYDWTSFIITISSLILATVILAILATFMIKYIMKWRYEYKSKYENKPMLVKKKEVKKLLEMIKEENEEENENKV